MNIDGSNTLACTKAIDDVKERRKSLPAAAHAGRQRPRARHDQAFTPSYATIKPWLQSESESAERASASNHARRREELDGLWECILCACCSTSCPSYWWNSDRYLGPAVLLQAYRWLADSRDESHRRTAG